MTNEEYQEELRLLEDAFYFGEIDEDEYEEALVELQDHYNHD